MEGEFLSLAARDCRAKALNYPGIAVCPDRRAFSPAGRLRRALLRDNMSVELYEPFYSPLCPENLVTGVRAGIHEAIICAWGAMAH
ncbi:MAG: hypothetical protein ACLTZY_07595 [Alistipes indistinctus]